MQMLFPRYRKQLVRCALLFVAGMALQFIGGNVNPSFLAYPWNLVLVANYLYLLVLLYTKQDAWKFVRGLYDRPATLVSLFALLGLTLVFGLVPQDGSSEGILGLLGFTRMNTSWIFCLFLFHFMNTMGLKVLDDVFHWRKRRFPVVIMHLSFFVILVASLFGSGDKTRVRVMAHQGHPVNVGIAEGGKMVQLPFALELKEFSLEGDSIRFHYLSKVTVTDDDGARDAEIRVNHPLRVEQWWIYQSGYDRPHGSSTVISILECVKDSWYVAVCVAMWMVLLAGGWMFIRGWKDHREGKEDGV